ncbi:MAG: MBL fold metallo-hydrolase [Lentimicrobiaceae bacterium]|jgi:glyoxylase-like metal-dependent hydrolase (beta-lactamase superfamily II)
MKKIYKRIFIVSGALILIVVLSIAYLLKARSVIKEMTPVETGETVKNVYSVKDSFVNFYMIRDGENYIAIDAGNDKSNIQQELKKLDIDNGKVVAILLTHTDGDHVAGISLFKNADVYLSKQEEQMINGNKSRFLVFGNKIDSDKYILIEDQQIINMGNTKIQCFLVPGHTPGSTCYLINDSLLFTGDALRLSQGKVEKFYGFFNMDTETASQSIGKIVQIPGVQYLFTAHNGYSDDFKKAARDWTK